MSTIIKNRHNNKWESLYGIDINLFCRKDMNLSDIENKTAARTTLGIVNDVTIHNHDSRYNPLIAAETSRRISGDSANRAKLTQVKNDMAAILTPSIKTDMVNRLNTLNSNVDTEISTRTSSDNTLMNNIKANINAAQTALDNAQVKEINFTGMGFNTLNGTIVDHQTLSVTYPGTSTVTTTRDFAMKDGFAVGKHKLDELLAKLAKLSHQHMSTSSTTTKNCNCDCNDSRCCGSK